MSIQARCVYRVYLGVAASKRRMTSISGGNYCELIIKVRSAKKWKWSYLSCFFSATHLAKSTLHSSIIVAIYIAQRFLQKSSVTMMIYLRTSDLN